MAQSEAQKAAFQKMLAARGKGKPKGTESPKEEMMESKPKGKMAKEPDKKKESKKIDMMLAKSMPGIPMSGKGKKSGTKKGKC